MEHPCKWSVGLIMCQVCHKVNQQRIKFTHLSKTSSTMYPTQRDENLNAFRLLLIESFEFLFEIYEILMEGVHCRMFMEDYSFDGINCLCFHVLISARVKTKPNTPPHCIYHQGLIKMVIRHQLRKLNRTWDHFLFQGGFNCENKQLQRRKILNNLQNPLLFPNLIFIEALVVNILQVNV